jgi:excisionase family DNA binding protein
LEVRCCFPFNPFYSNNLLDPPNDLPGSGQVDAWWHPPCVIESARMAPETKSTFEPTIGRSVSIDHAAELLGVSRRTIYNRIRENRLRTVRTAGGSQRVLIESLGGHPEAASDANAKPKRGSRGEEQEGL